MIDFIDNQAYQGSQEADRHRSLRSAGEGMSYLVLQREHTCFFCFYSSWLSFNGIFDKIIWVQGVSLYIKKFKFFRHLFVCELSLQTLNSYKTVSFNPLSHFEHKDKIFKKNYTSKGVNLYLPGYAIFEIVHINGFAANNSKLVLFDFPDDRAVVNTLFTSKNSDLLNPWFKFILFSSHIVQPKLDGAWWLILNRIIFWEVDQRMIISFLWRAQIFIFGTPWRWFFCRFVCKLVHQFRFVEIFCIKVCQSHIMIFCTPLAIFAYNPTWFLLDANQIRIWKVK